LTPECKEKELGKLFEEYGPVYKVAVVKDKDFGFIEMLSR
jgi:RNA recognition motif-containing protein